MDFYFFKSVCAERRAEFFDEIKADAFFIPTTDRIKLQAVNTAQSLKPFHVIIRGVLRPEISVADPGGRTPCGTVESNFRIAFLRLAQNPPGVTARVIQVV